MYVTVFKKNTIATLFVTFTVRLTVTFYAVTRTVTPIVTLNCNGNMTVTIPFQLLSLPHAKKLVFLVDKLLTKSKKIVDKIVDKN